MLVPVLFKELEMFTFLELCRQNHRVVCMFCYTMFPMVDGYFLEGDDITATPPLPPLFFSSSFSSPNIILQLPVKLWFNTLTLR